MCRGLEELRDGEQQLAGLAATTTTAAMFASDLQIPKP